MFRKDKEKDMEDNKRILKVLDEYYYKTFCKVDIKKNRVYFSDNSCFVGEYDKLTYTIEQILQRLRLRLDMAFQYHLQDGKELEVEGVIRRICEINILIKECNFSNKFKTHMENDVYGREIKSFILEGSKDYRY